MLEMGKLKSNFFAFTQKTEIKKKIEAGWSKHKEFLELYPFKTHPEKIDDLTPEKIYNPGGEYFVYWIEHGLKALGAIGIANAHVWENAKNNPAKFKYLLKIALDDSTIGEKIDADWDSIPRFGGERQIAKKIIFCYYPDKMIPVFRNEDMRIFCENFEIDYDRMSKEKFNEAYEDLTIGNKYELLNELLLNFKDGISWLKGIDNVYFMRFLYELLPREKGINTAECAGTVSKSILGILLMKFKEGKISKEQILKIFEDVQSGSDDFYEEMLLNLLKTLCFDRIPYYENEVIFIFSKVHAELGFPKIKEIHPTKYPDVIALDKEGKERRIELEVFASGFNHDPKGSDFIICWNNDISEEQSKKLPRIISLEEFLLNSRL